MNLRTVLLAGLAGAVVTVLAGSRLLLFAVLAATALALLAVYARAHLYDRLEYTRELSQRVVPWGAEIELVTAVANRKWLPVVWLRVVDGWPAGVEALNARIRPAPARGGGALDQAVFLRWYERVRRHYRVRCGERGVHAFGPATLEASDPFGLAGVEHAVAGQTMLVVLPKVLAVPALDLVRGRPLIGAPVVRSLARDPASFAGVRPYSPGDPLRAVNWRATARTGAMHTNQWEPTTAAEVRILLNVQAHRYVYEGITPELTELLCVVAASLAGAFDAAGFAVGLLSNARLSRQMRAAFVSPGTGTLPDILDTLARVIAYPPPPFEIVLAAEVDDAVGAWGETEYVVVTPELFGESTRLLAELAEHNAVRVVYVGDPTPAMAGLVDARVPAEFDWRTRDALALA